MGDVVTLRKLTRKSKLNNGGPWSDKTVGELLERDKGVLVWVYYHQSNITFMDDILDELYIFPNQRVEKPGKNPEMFEKRRWRMARDFADKGDRRMLNRLMRASYKKKKDRLESEEGWEKYHTSKARLTWVNQGHR